MVIVRSSSGGEVWRVRAYERDRARPDIVTGAKQGPMNVLYTIAHGEMGGVHRFLDSVIEHHDPARVRPVILSFRPGHWLDELASRGFRIHLLDDARLRTWPRCSREIIRIMREESIDLVHSSYAWCHALAAPAAYWRRCRTVWFHHGPMGDGRWQGVLPLMPADLLLANSYFLLGRLNRTWHASRRTGVVHYGVDGERIAPDEQLRTRFRSEWNLAPGTLAIGLIGFIDIWKGQDIFLQAALRLRDSGLPARFFIVGGPRDGVVEDRCVAFQKQLHKFVRDHRMEESVSFTGHVDVMAGALDGLDIVVHASTEPEPFGMVILEAMAKGKPIIASCEGGPAEIITHAENGLLIAPRSPETLADTIEGLGQNPQLRADLSRRARETALTRFHPARACGALEDFYESLQPR